LIKKTLLNIGYLTKKFPKKNGTKGGRLRKMANKIIYPEVSFTPEWKEGRRFEKERIIKIIKSHIEPTYPINCKSIINEIGGKDD